MCVSDVFFYFYSSTAPTLCLFGGVCFWTKIQNGDNYHVMFGFIEKHNLVYR